MSIRAQSIKSRKANIMADIKLVGIDTKVEEACEKLFCATQCESKRVG